MLNPFRPKDRNPLLTEEIRRVADELSGLSAADENYKTVAANYRALIQTQLEQQDRISANTKALIAANLAGIVIVLFHEQAHVIGSKAWGMIRAAK